MAVAEPASARKQLGPGENDPGGHDAQTDIGRRRLQSGTTEMPAPARHLEFGRSTRPEPRQHLRAADAEPYDWRKLPRGIAFGLLFAVVVWAGLALLLWLWR